MNYKFDGSRVFHMNETIIANWNSVVGPDDIIFHLGDFCLGDSAEWINGKHSASCVFLSKL